MNGKNAKKMRREVRNQLKNTLGETESAFMTSVRSASFTERVVFALRVVFNRWPGESGQKQ